MLHNSNSTIVVLVRCYLFFGGATLSDPGYLLFLNLSYHLSLCIFRRKSIVVSALSKLVLIATGS